MHPDGDLPPDDRNPDWPDDWPAPTGPEPDSRPRGRRIAALTLTALVALGAGAGAVYVYQSGLAGATPATSPGQGSRTGATQFSGSTRSFGQVHVGDIVAVQIAEFDDVARVLSLPDPATAWGR